jgi:PadR family transcriptional regulator PadR
LRKQTLEGNVETLILAVLEAGPSYGYAIVKELNARAKGLLQLGEGTIYPVLHRMEDKKLISSSWRVAENGRERKYYLVTAKGRRALAANYQEWQMLSAAMKRVLGPARRFLREPAVKGATI